MNLDGGEDIHPDHHSHPRYSPKDAPLFLCPIRMLTPGGGESFHTETLVLSRPSFFPLCLSFPVHTEGWVSSIALLQGLGHVCVFFSPLVGEVHEPAPRGPLVSAGGHCLHPLHTSCLLGEGPGLGSPGQASWPQGSFPLLWNPAWSLKFSTLNLWLKTLELLQFPDLKTAPPPVHPPPRPTSLVGWSPQQGLGAQTVGSTSLGLQL